MRAKRARALRKQAGLNNKVPTTYTKVNPKKISRMVPNLKTQKMEKKEYMTYTFINDQKQVYTLLKKDYYLNRGK